MRKLHAQQLADQQWPARRWRATSTPQPSWMSEVRVGTVLLTNGGAPRVVRSVTRYSTGELASVTFVIKKCSWTHRCYTIYNYSDLKSFGYTLAPVKPRALSTRMDRRIARDVNHPRSFGEDMRLDCCDVRGLP